MQCKCGKKAIYIRKWEGNGYCKRCLITSVERIFRKTISMNRIIKNEKIALVVKKGFDLVMLHIFLNTNLPPVDCTLITENKYAKNIGKKNDFLIKQCIDRKYDKLIYGDCLDEEASICLKLILFNKILNPTILKPLRYIHSEELRFYAHFKHIPILEIKKDIYAKMLDDLENYYPDVKIQVVKYYEKLLSMNLS